MFLVSCRSRCANYSQPFDVRVIVKEFPNSSQIYCFPRVLTLLANNEFSKYFRGLKNLGCFPKPAYRRLRKFHVQKTTCLTGTVKGVTGGSIIVWPFDGLTLFSRSVYGKKAFFFIFLSGWRLRFHQAIAEKQRFPFTFCG